MYAIKGHSYRAIASADDLQDGEVAASEIPQALRDEIAAMDRNREGVARDLDAKADAALSSLRAYRDLASPTNAQTVAVVRLLCRVAIVLIRHRLGRFDGTD